ncbi:MAG: cell division protein FtsL [Clostridia bacterium]|nr:cell division protein FtsL [Clostridia bacterium]
MARSGYQYETSPRKLEPEYRPQRRKNKTVRNVKPKNNQTKNTKIHKKEKSKRIKQLFTVFALFVVLVAISYRNSTINESFSKVQSLKSQLSEIEKENEQLEVSIENSLNLNNIEQVAKEKLGMQKLTNRQTVYVELPKKDYVKSANEKVIITEEQSWIKNLIEKIFK